MASELLKRSEVKEADTWNVKDMYPTTEAWENELKVITEIVDKIASYEGSVAATAENLLAVLEHLASAGEKIEKAFNYAERLFDEDQTNTTHQAMSAKVYSLYAAMGSKTAFADPEIIAASDETLEAFYKELPALELYRKQIAEIRRMKEGAMEIKFFDRLKALEKLEEITGQGETEAPPFYEALENSAKLLQQQKEEEKA